MAYDKDKVDEMTLALLWLVMWDDVVGARAWKGFDCETMDRLYQRGLTCDPRGKAQSAAVTPEGRQKAEELSRRHFAKDR